MALSDTHLQQVLANIRELRSNEINFTKLQTLLDEELQQSSDAAYSNALEEIKEKYALAYTEAREQGGSAWPEFEQFVTQFERSITAAQKA